MFGNGSARLASMGEKLNALAAAVAGLSRGLDKQSTENTRRFDAIETALKEVREDQLRKKNGNGTAQAVKKNAAPVGGGAAGGAGLLYLLQNLLQ